MMQGLDTVLKERINQKAGELASSFCGTIEAIDRQVELLGMSSGDYEAEIQALLTARAKVVQAANYSGSLTLSLLNQGQVQPVSSGMDSLPAPDQPFLEQLPSEQ